MKFNQKLLMFAKGIGVWWGIYLILGCCACIAVNTVQDMFLSDVRPFRMAVLIPFMAAGALVLAVITYFINLMIKTAPAKRLRRRLFRIFRNEGFSQDYINLLFDSARDDMKNPMIIEAAAAYCFRGETDAAAKTLERADLTSITDVAVSTGDFRTAAYYYCVKMAMCIVSKNAEGAAQAYKDGEGYLDAFSDSDPVMAVLAMFQTEGGLSESALETVRKIKWNSLPRSARKYGIAFAEMLKAENLLAMGRYEEAHDCAEFAMRNSCSEYMTSMLEDIIKRCSGEKDADGAETKETNKEDTL